MSNENLDDEFHISPSKSPEIDMWLDSHIILDKQFVWEAEKFKIGVWTNMFRIYALIRKVEKNSKEGFCMLDADELASFCELTKRQAIESLYELRKKGAIKKIRCSVSLLGDIKKIYVSSEVLDKLYVSRDESIPDVDSVDVIQSLTA